MHATLVPDIDGLRQITEVMEGIPVEILHQTWPEIEYQLDILRGTKGAQVELI